MASKEPPPEAGPGPFRREPIPAGKRKRLEKLFEMAGQKAATAQTQHDFDYITNLLTECVAADPAIRPTLMLTSRTSRKNTTTSAPGRWPELKEPRPRGPEESPLATAVGRGYSLRYQSVGGEPLGFGSPQGDGIRCQQERRSGLRDHLLDCRGQGQPQGPDLQPAARMALAERGLLDDADGLLAAGRGSPADRRRGQAKHCHAIGPKGPFQRQVRRRARDRAEVQAPAQKEEEASLEKKLQEKIKEEPQNVKLYLELAQFYLNEERYDKAEEVFGKAFEASDGDQEILEKWEDTQIRRLRQQIARTDDENARKGAGTAVLEKIGPGLPKSGTAVSEQSHVPL